MYVLHSKEVGGGGQLDANLMGPLEKDGSFVRLIQICEPTVVALQHTVRQFYF
jgi:hypothetical protein